MKHQPWIAADLLRLMGRIKIEEHLQRELVTEALTSSHLPLREAAVEAVEQWGESQLLDILLAHHDPVDWLQCYIENVINDLS